MEKKKLIIIGVGIIVAIIISILGLMYFGKINMDAPLQTNIIDCSYTESTSTCDPNTGKKTITRNIVTKNSSDGKACPAEIEIVDCDVNCVMSDYTWGICNDDTGIQEGTRTILVSPKNNGAACPSTTLSRPCLLVSQTVKDIT